MTPGLCPTHRALVTTCRLCPTYATPDATPAPPATAPGPTCPVHGSALTSFCPKCRGSKGGKVVTPRKVASLRRVVRERERNRKARNAKPEGDEHV